MEKTSEQISKRVMNRFHFFVSARDMERIKRRQEIDDQMETERRNLLFSNPNLKVK